jgi:hypothetical protein
MNIRKIYFNALRNEAHYQFLLEVKTLIDNDAVVHPSVGDLLPPFYSLLEKEGALVDALQSSFHTKELADANRRMDRALVAINSSISSALHHFDPALVKAARHLKLRLKAFHGDIENKPYEEEAAAINILLNDFRTVHAPEVAVIGIAPLLTELEAAHDAFNQRYVDRNKERSERPQGNLKQLRRDISAPYRAITGRIEALAVVNGEAAYAPFIRQLNQLVAYFNEHTHHQSKKDIRNAVVAAIPLQPATGKPLTPIPTVTMDEKELAFTADFYLDYKNNLKPGTASVIIHGKGKYKGKREVTFNIIKS